MPEKQYIVDHTAVMLPAKEPDQQMGPTLQQGRAISREDLPDDASWERLVEIGAAREATPAEIEAAKAHAIQDAAMEATPGGPKAQELADARAKAERALAEPAAQPAEPEGPEPKGPAPRPDPSKR